MKVFIPFGILAMFSNVVCAQIAGIIPQDIVTTRLENAMIEPEGFLTWLGSAPDVANYTNEQSRLQRKVNKQSDEIITSTFATDSAEWTAIEFEPITPYTWKWVDMEVVKEDGTLALISLRRPNWWIVQNDAGKIGNTIFLDLPEMGINKRHATVIAIRVNQLDTRFWRGNINEESSYQPITGKFIHDSNGVVNLYFEDYAKPLGVTFTHRIWSVDRNNWIEASKLMPGEHVRTYGNKTVRMLRSSQQQGNQKVYNLEVYRHHNYFVSVAEVLVHNHCLDQRQLTNIIRQSRIPRDAGQPNLLNVKPGQGHVNRSKMNRIYDEILVNPNFWKNVDPSEGPIVIHRYNDGKMILMNGHHRYLALSAASRVEGFEMPDLKDPSIIVIKDFNLPSTGRKSFEWNKLTETRDIK